MKLPGGDGAHIDPRKLVGYALKRDHEIGGPKARVFEATGSGLTMGTDKAYDRFRAKQSRMKMLDVVSLKKARPQDGLIAGERGAIVEEVGSDFMVEFVDEGGQTRAMPVINAVDLNLVWEAPVEELTSQDRRKAG